MILIAAHLGPGEFSLTIVGHESGGSGEDGRVCAAVSAISQTALLGLAEIEANHPEHVQCTITERESTS